jgi:hypothetical protein
MTRLPQPSTAARVDLERQLCAHDVLDLLIAQRGAVDVLHLLRYWYVVDALRIRGRRPTEVQKRS